MVQLIDLGIIAKNTKYMVKYGFIKNNCVSSIVVARYCLNKL